LIGAETLSALKQSRSAKQHRHQSIPIVQNGAQHIDSEKQAYAVSGRIREANVALPSISNGIATISALVHISQNHLRMDEADEKSSGFFQS
jgi:hypothetical protein